MRDVVSPTLQLELPLDPLVLPAHPLIVDTGRVGTLSRVTPTFASSQSLAYLPAVTPTLFAGFGSR
jgi:hypothetical protein